jgi:parallel beta-helix repeat protein
MRSFPPMLVWLLVSLVNSSCSVDPVAPPFEPAALVHAGGSVADTSSVTVVPGPPVAIRIITEPGGAISGSRLAQQPVVELRNEQNRPVLQRAVIVTVARATGSGKLGGKLTATTNAQGRARFTALKISGSGLHKLEFSALRLPKATSQGFMVTPRPGDNEIVISPGTQIQPIVNQNPPGTRFLLKAGTHVGQMIVPKDFMQFRGETGTVLDGRGKVGFAFEVWRARGVQIRNLEITGYVSPQNDLGTIIQDPSSPDLLLENLNVHHIVGAGANLNGSFTVRGGSFHHNAMIGLSVPTGTDGLIDSVEIAYNNPDSRFDPLWGSGGIKIHYGERVTVRRCRVHHNVGPGIWYDGNNRGSLIEDNLVTDNTHVGIFYEISLAGVIRGNILLRNGTVHKGIYGAGILVATSQDVEVRDNVLDANANGIVAIQENRSDGYPVRNLWVHDNTVKQGTGGSGLVNLVPGDAMLRTMNNRFEGNVYNIGGNPSPFWMGALVRVSRSGWQARGQDQNSTFAGP